MTNAARKKLVLDIFEIRDTWSNCMVPALRVRPQRSTGRRHVKKDVERAH